MGNRWLILAVLFIVRTAMGYQFQSVASVSTLLIDDLDIDYAQFGLLIGLYMFPGIVLAYPGGLLGRRFGDKQVVGVALALMAIGASIIGISESYPLALAGRTLSGVGAVLLNVLLAKMVADWFFGKEIVTAMAILVTSWPLGISLALISLGPLAAASSWLLAMHLTAIACLLGLVLVVVFYQTPSATSIGQETNSTVFKLSRQEILLVTVAGIIWALFNVGFVIVPSFAAAFLTSAGYSIVTAGSLVSVATWIVIPSIPLGGYIAERLKRPNIFMVSCFLGIGITICLVPYWQYPLILFLVIGLLFGPPAGIIMSLPVEVLLPENRAAGMGIYYTCYYIGMAALSPLAGLLRDLTQNPAAPLFFGGAVIFITISILGLFRTLQRRMCDVDIHRNDRVRLYISWFL